ncbi:hypothetical protein OG874_22475 [Nocardia sp. NBC_00565]|uniref:hypothetical protein n=1 Tax=Nocardia sp. NBC_00565 TaxID=2975993 RepID=UPI002E81A8ED|nr:hypothetical protein [Nocardia sp. NBC_00565]WUC07685.1 hypothetical protein OG874_22475 [Nocardia sp. NBC_00565]
MADMTMNDMLIPNMADPTYPHEYDFAPVVEQNYLMVYDFFDTLFKSLGKGSKTDPPTDDNLPLLPNTVPTNQSRFFQSYASVVLALKQAAINLRDSDKRLMPLIQDAKKTIDDGKVAINALIDEVNAAAPKYPPTGITESDYIVTYITTVFKDGEKALNDLKTRLEQAAADVKDPTDDGSDKTLSSDPKDIDTGNYDTEDPGNTTTDDSAYTPPAIDTGDADTGTDTTNGLGSTTGDSSDTSGVGDNLQNAIDKLENAGTGSTDTPTTPAVDSGSSGTGSMMDSMLPMMMAQAGQRNAADSDLNSRRDELDPNRYEQYPGAAVPVTAQPAVAQPATAAPAAANTAPPQASSSQPVGAPVRVADADGSVVYTFPDGRTQKVSAIVAQVLDGAFGNASGTDAQKAYEKTTSKWTDKKQIGAKVDPYQLMTGDVATWDNRTAILVVFPAEDGGTLEAIVNGQLKQFTPEMADTAGEFGTFTGFSHPNGIELASGDKNATPTVPGAGDPSAAAIPVVAAPV